MHRTSLIIQTNRSFGQLVRRPTRIFYISPEDYFDRAYTHLYEGDFAQASEKGYGGMKFGVRSFVIRLSSLALAEAPRFWTAHRYENICVALDILLANTEYSAAFYDPWCVAKALHQEGWNANELGFESIELGLRRIQQAVQNMETIPVDIKLMEGLFNKTMKHEQGFVVYRIHQLIEQEKKFEARALLFKYDEVKMKEIIDVYKKKYEVDLAQMLNFH